MKFFFCLKKIYASYEKYSVGKEEPKITEIYDEDIDEDEEPNIKELLEKDDENEDDNDEVASDEEEDISANIPIDDLLD